MAERKAESPGLKNDGGKPELSMIDREAACQLARVLEFGKGKYARDNWRGGIQWTRVIDAILRHAFAIADGEDIDPESGMLHSAHVMCNAMFLTNFYKNHRELDDRTKPKT